MPIYEYIAKDAKRRCEHCRNAFEALRRVSDPPIERCPKCDAPVVKQISAPAVGASKSGFDDRAKASGFHKLERRGKGEYEKKY